MTDFSIAFSKIECVLSGFFRAAGVDVDDRVDGVDSWSSTNKDLGTLLLSLVLDIPLGEYGIFTRFFLFPLRDVTEPAIFQVGDDASFLVSMPLAGAHIRLAVMFGFVMILKQYVCIIPTFVKAIETTIFSLADYPAKNSVGEIGGRENVLLSK